MYFPALFTEKFRNNDNLPSVSTSSIKVVFINYQERGLFGGMVDSGLEPEIDNVSLGHLVGSENKDIVKE